MARNLAVCELVSIHKVMECDTPLEKLYHKKKKGEGCVFKDVSKYKNLFLLNYQISISRNTLKFNTLKKSIIYLSLKKP